MTKHSTNTPLLGYITERKAELWLIDHGHEVYYNAAPCGKADLVIWNREDHPIPVDVKTYSLTTFSRLQAEPYPGVTYLWYHKQYGFAWIPPPHCIVGPCF